MNLNVSNGSFAGAHKSKLSSSEKEANEKAIADFKASHPDKCTVIVKVDKAAKKRGKTLAKRLSKDSLAKAAKAIEGVLGMQARTSQEIMKSVEKTLREGEANLVPVKIESRGHIQTESLECKNSTQGIMHRRIREGKLSEPEAMNIIINGDPGINAK